jgi:hypothetical protein
MPKLSELHNRILSFILGIFILFNIAQTALQSYNLSIDGDLIKIGLPAFWYQPVLDDPIGIHTVLKQKDIGGAGRFMTHKTIFFWCHDVIPFFQKIAKDKVKGIFLATACLDTFLLLFLMWMMLAIMKQFIADNYVLYFFVLAITSSFLQFNNYYGAIGLIDLSVSYVFYYALSLFGLAYYYLHFYKAYHQKAVHFSIAKHILLIALTIYLSFAGPLVQPVVFIVSLLIGCCFIFGGNVSFNLFIKNKHFFFQLIWMLLICLWAFYVSTFNTEKVIGVSLVHRYYQLAKGIYHLFADSIAYFIISIYLIFNAIMLRKYCSAVWHQSIRYIYVLCILFISIYTLLLPLGGYRSYRPYIIRHDTLLPISLVVLFLIIYSFIANIQKSNAVYIKKICFACCIVFVSVFTISDRNLVIKSSDNQIKVFKSMLVCNDTIFKMPHDANVGTWSPEEFDDVNFCNLLASQFQIWGLLKPWQKIVRDK